MGGVFIVRIMYGVPTVKVVARVGDGLDGHLGAVIYNVFIRGVAFHHAGRQVRGGGSHDGGNAAPQVVVGS